VRLLAQKGVNVNASEGDGTTALHWASYHDDLESVNQLIRAGAAAIESATDEKLFPAGSATKVAVLEMVEVSDKDPRPEDQAFWKQKRASKVQ